MEPSVMVLASQRGSGLNRPRHTSQPFSSTPPVASTHRPGSSAAVVNPVIPRITTRYSTGLNWRMSYILGKRRSDRATKRRRGKAADRNVCPNIPLRSFVASSLRRFLFLWFHEFYAFFEAEHRSAGWRGWGEDDEAAVGALGEAYVDLAGRQEHGGGAAFDEFVALVHELLGAVREVFGELC